MNPLVASFHIDTGMLLAQAINFAIVFGVLYVFVVKPLIKVLDERAAMVKKGEEDTVAAAERLGLAEQEYAAKLAEARKEAHALLSQAEEEGERRRIVAMEELKKELDAERIEDRHREAERAEAFRREMRKETADIVAQSLRKVLGSKDITDADTVLITRALGDVSDTHI
ncbi:MAG: ATP synthase F0 subunit B [Candidatus Yonathbacteria bacterium]|nr:ATP synthase F0 subunit B [Candidatus Yonathbacteria bacterium]